MKRATKTSGDGHHGSVAVDVRVCVYPGTDAEDRGLVVDDFGELAGQAVNIGAVM